MSLIHKHTQLIIFILICGSILLLAPMIQIIIVAGLIAIYESDKLSPSQLIVFIYESFIIYYMLTIPAIILLILSCYLSLWSKKYGKTKRTNF